jgi:hypothetical protein
MAHLEDLHDKCDMSLCKNLSGAHIRDDVRGENKVSGAHIMTCDVINNVSAAHLLSGIPTMTITHEEFQLKFKPVFFSNQSIKFDTFV